MSKKALIAFALALITGMAVGWNRVEEAAPALPDTTRKTSPRATPSRPVWTTDDFIRFTRNRMEERTQRDYNPLTQKLADWTDGEIIAALDASLTDPDIVLMAGGANGLDGDLLGEWMRRDFEAALSWFEHLGSRSAKARLAFKLSEYWPRDQTDRGLGFMHANFELFPGNDRHGILKKAFENAGDNGPAAMEKLLQVVRESNLGLPINPWYFPPEFDFATLADSKEIEAIWGTGDAMILMETWLGRDRDEAADWMLENHGAKSMTLLIKNIGMENADWVAGKFEKLSETQRAELLQEMKAHPIFVPHLTPLFESIRNPAVLKDAYKLGADLLVQGNVEDFIPRLEELEKPSLRISLLETASPAGVTADGEARLRQKLADWKASPQQIETIVSRFKQ